MPMMNGFELARRLKENPETNFIPLVMMTALTDLEARIRTLDAGVDDFLSKPVDYAELLARVNASFKVKQYHDEIIRQKREKEELWK
jgi:DNA-binding response OmpR family regulator